MAIVSFRLNNLFTDFAKLERAIGSASAKALRSVGFQLRTRLKNSIRRNNGTSLPGNPPFAHAPGNSGLKRVEFRLESKYRLVVGPAKYGKQLQDIPAPSALEFGKTVRANREQDVAIRYVKRRGKRVPFVNGRAVPPKLPPGIVENSRGLLVNRSNGKYLTKPEAIRVRKQAFRQAVGVAKRIGKIRKYRARPFVAPVLAKALSDGIIPAQFRNILGGA